MSEAAASGRRPGGSLAGLFSDSRLARRASDGDQRAFTAIFNRYHQSLYRYCLTIVGDQQDAQDALQNTMVKVLRALPGEKRRIELKPWLYRIAHNESIEILRRRRATVQMDPELAASGSGLAQEAETRERLRRLIADLDELPDRQRSALVMRELAGLDFAEIGAALETSPAVARQTVYEARLSLSQMEGGREMSCAAVTKALSDGDGRVMRRRDVRAHLRGCASCRRFREELDHRGRDLAALAPLPAVAATGLLQGILGAGSGSGSGSAAGGIAGTLGAASGKALGTSVVVKSAATVAVVAAVGFSATKAGLVPVSLPGKGSSPPASGGVDRQLTPATPLADPGGDGGTESAGSRASEKSDIAGSRAAIGAARGSAPAAKGLEQSTPDPTPAPSAPGSAGRGTDRAGQKQLPAAAAHGQQTAAAHKATGKGGGKASGGRSAKTSQPPHPAPPPKSNADHAKKPPSKAQGPDHEMPAHAESPPQSAKPEGTPPPSEPEKGKP